MQSRTIRTTKMPQSPIMVNRLLPYLGKEGKNWAKLRHTVIIGGTQTIKSRSASLDQA